MWSSRAGLNGEQFSHGKKLKYDHNSYGSGIAKNRREFSATDLNASQHTSGSPGISGLFELKNVGSITSYRPYSSSRTKGSTSDLVKDLYSDLLTSDSVNSWDLASFQVRQCNDSTCYIYTDRERLFFASTHHFKHN